LHGGKTSEVLREEVVRVVKEDKRALHLRRNKLEPSELPPCFFVNDVLDFGVSLRQRLIQDLVLEGMSCTEW
jgi:hypothetical protein